MLHACGITTFLTPLPSGTAAVCDGGGDAEHHALQHTHSASLSATGEIKTTPEDFVVVEIDPTGQRTDAHTYTFPDVEAPNASPYALAMSEATGSGGEEGGERRDVSEAGGGVVDTDGAVVALSRTLQDLRCVVADQAPSLRAMFGTATEIGRRATTTLTPREITALLHDVQLSAQGALPALTVPNGATLGAADASSEASRWWRGCQLLGDFTDRRDRQLVHLLVRRCFPHVRSFAEPPATTLAAAPSRPGGSVASVVSCALDLHFVLFSATLGTEAALCISQWAVAAQAARQERSLDVETREALQSVAPVEEGTVPPAVQKGVCFTSFDALSEVMRRGCDVQEQQLTTSALPLQSEKDVRRHVHDLLRRFYPFLRCQVRDGQAVLCYRPRPAPNTAPGPSGAVALVVTPSPPTSSASSASASSGVVIGVRRPRDEGGEGDTTLDASSASASGFLHVIVTKRNLDTAELRQLLAEHVGVKDSAVCIAGMKDKKAITTQRCSLPLTGAVQKGCSALAASTPESPTTLRWPADPQNSYAVVVQAAPRSSPVHLGQLKGNWFSLRVVNLRWIAAAADTSAMPSGNVDALRAFVSRRFSSCVERGFINYYGQQRFGETIDRADDHTGVHLFAGRWVEAVRSLYRGCPEVYAGFPDRMEARFAPGNSRDAQVMTHALRQTHRMYFAEHPLTRADVQLGSPLWTQLCEKAITEGVAYFLRSLWVHAGQSVFFNLTASYLVDGARCPSLSPPADASDSLLPPLQPLPFAVVARAQLPLGGYVVHQTAAEGEGWKGAETDALWCAWRERATQHALHTLRWTSAQAFEQRKVAGVPVPGSWRSVVVRPQDAALTWEAAEAEKQPSTNSSSSSTEAVQPSMRLSFALPSSSYATVFLREVLGCDTWW